MKYFYDCEFIEDGLTIDLISIGIVAEDGREMYLQNASCALYKASLWVRDNVLPNLTNFDADHLYSTLAESWRDRGEPWKYHQEIGPLVKALIGDDKPEFWGYYSAYDHVALCQLFGPMIDLPKGWPMFTRDIIQECKRLGNPKLPKQGEGIGAEHNALADARWNKQAYEFLRDECSTKSTTNVSALL